MKAHSMLLIRLSEWVPRLYMPGTRELAREIFTELTAWIQNHIIRVDCQLRHCPQEKTKN
jgi:hemerythrin